MQNRNKFYHKNSLHIAISKKKRIRLLIQLGLFLSLKLQKNYLLSK